MNALTNPIFILALLLSLLSSGCDSHEGSEEHHEERHRILVTNPVAKDVISTQQYVCQIHSRRHIEIRALEDGYLQEVNIKEGQSVSQGDILFKIMPVLYQAGLNTELAEAQLARIKYKNTQQLSKQSVVSDQELALAKAELARARAKVNRARAELNFTALRAPFDGIVDRQRQQQGSLVEEGDILSTLSDNEVMWVYFNVPEARYLAYKANKNKDDLKIELKLANGAIFAHPGEIGAIEADFNNETGNIPFRADFPNPDNLLRHGQTGTILVHAPLKDAIVIPQRATYEILAKKYVYVVEPPGSKPPAHAAKAEEDEHHEEGEEGEHHEEAHEKTEHHGDHYGVVRQREIVIKEEMDDIYVIEKGLSPSDKIIFEGVREVRDGDEIEYEVEPADKILENLKNHAE